MNVYEVWCGLCFVLFKQKTAYDIRISDWSSDVCSSDLFQPVIDRIAHQVHQRIADLLQHRLVQLGVLAMQLQPDLLVDRKSVVEGKSVSVRVDLGGRRIIKKNKSQIYIVSQNNT